MYYFLTPWHSSVLIFWWRLPLGVGDVLDDMDCLAEILRNTPFTSCIQFLTFNCLGHCDLDTGRVSALVSSLHLPSIITDKSLAEAVGGSFKPLAMCYIR